MNSINWPASSVWVFIAQLGEHCSANAEATGSNPVEAPKIFFSGYFRNCLNCDSLRWSHTHFICIPAVHSISFTDIMTVSNDKIIPINDLDYEDNQKIIIFDDYVCEKIRIKLLIISSKGDIKIVLLFI